MSSTFEIGFQVNESSFDLPNYWDDVGIHNFDHIQVKAESIEKIRSCSEIVRNIAGYEKELSYYLHGTDQFTNFITRPDSVFLAAKEYKAKFIVISDYFDMKNDGSEPIMVSNLASIVDLAERNRKFLCLEKKVLDNGFHDWKRSVEELKSLAPSRFLLISLNLTTLMNTPKVKNYTDQIRTWLATFNITVDLNSSPESPNSDPFADLLAHLYWLPYRQQPLIFVNPVEELNAVHQRFGSIVEEFGFKYP